MKFRSFALTVMTCTLLAAPAGSAATRPDSKAVLSPVAFSVLTPPVPVPGSDGRVHLAYEIEMANQSNLNVQVRRIAPRTRGKALGKPLSGSALADRMRLNAGGTGTTLGAGESATVFVDAAYRMNRRTPGSVRHSITLSWPDPANPGETIEQTLVGVPTEVNRSRPVRLRSPLRGPGWVAANGCCELTAHRGATLAIDGTIRVPERFAIDFVQIDGDGKLFNGPLNQLSSYPYFGVPVHAAAAGRVVRVRDGLPEQTPGAFAPGATIQNAGGNHVVVRIAKHRFAFYAHLKTGTVKVRPGQRVKAGQVLGRLGNTGNSDAPHLHFHIMDTPSPLQSNGLPFTFNRFRGQGRITDIEDLMLGGGGDPDRDWLPGVFRNRIPLDNQVIAFPR